jgi:hypothetical protein
MLGVSAQQTKEGPALLAVIIAGGTIVEYAVHVISFVSTVRFLADPSGTQ